MTQLRVNPPSKPLCLTTIRDDPFGLTLFKVTHLVKPTLVKPLEVNGIRVTPNLELIWANKICGDPYFCGVTLLGDNPLGLFYIGYPLGIVL